MNVNRMIGAGLVAMAVVAASAAARADGETIAVFTKNQTNPFFQAVRLGADNAARQMNALTVHYVPTRPDSIPDQMSQIGKLGSPGEFLKNGAQEQQATNVDGRRQGRFVCAQMGIPVEDVGITAQLI